MRILAIDYGSQRIGLALPHAGGTIEPSPRRDVGYRIFGADNELPSFEMVVEDLVVSFGFTAIATDGIALPLGRGELKVHGLPREWAESGGDEK